MPYKELRKALLDKLGISPQALSQQAQKLKVTLPLTTEDAICIIAQRNRLKLDKYLDAETIQKIRGLLTQFTTPPKLPLLKKDIPNRKQENRQYIIRIGKEFKFTDPFLTPSKINEASEMTAIFPYLYLLENSIRNFIYMIMSVQYGNDWWNNEVKPELREKVNSRMATDKKDAWHQRRGSRPIDYLDFIELLSFLNKIEKVIVPDIIPDLEWFRQLIKEVYKSRCVVCHMNPLDKNNIDAVIVKFKQWQKQIDDKKELILKLVPKQ